MRSILRGLGAGLVGCVIAVSAFAQQSFTAFESGPVRPLALSPDGSRLFVVNTPDARLEIFRIGSGGIAREGSVAVGLEPVAVAARTNGEVWVVNHLSDSVSIVDVATSPPRVVRTFLVGDEPRDIVFAGPLVSGARSRAFVTAAHRGHGRPTAADAPRVDPQLSTEGVGRADVWVFDTGALGASLEGTPLTRITLFGDTPRALAVSPDGATVYAAVFHSGNKTTALNETLVCNDANVDGVVAGPCTVAGLTMPGGLPLPETDAFGAVRPEVGLIVKHDGAAWRDELGRDWSNAVKFSLPDRDVFRIDANANPPAETGTAYSGVGTILFNMVANPVSGKVYVTNTEARNEVRFEGPGFTAPGFSTTTVQGHLHEARITVLSGSTATPHHLNKHIDYAQLPAPAGVKDASLATPIGLAVNAAGTKLYVSAFSSSRVGVFDVAQVEADTFVPSAANHIPVSGGGPSGLVLDEARGRLYVATRFDNGVSVVDVSTKSETQKVLLHDREPAVVKNGRPVLYDAQLSSSNGEASCASCHVFGDLDSLAWDLGNPHDPTLTNLNPFRTGPIPILSFVNFHGLKGPMTTQTLRGLANAGPMHWRGDRSGANDPGGNALDENAAFNRFLPAFEGLLGRATPLPASTMQQFTDFMLSVVPPPNPIRALDGSLTADQLAGRTRYFGANTDGQNNCNGCHRLDPSQGFFGTDGLSSFEGETQHFKVAHLRNAYQKVGMFGFTSAGIGGTSTGFLGDQVRGFGFLHDGSIDTIFHFLSAIVFQIDDTEQAQLEAFMFAFDTVHAPVIGQQVTLTSTNAALANLRVDLLAQRASTSFVMADPQSTPIAGTLECELVAKGNVLSGADAGPRGWVLLSDGGYLSDRNTLYSDAQLRSLAATPGQELTFTCMPPGRTPGATAVRAGVDRDEDGVLDGLDSCPALSNAAQSDGDADIVGDGCDNCVAKANGSQSDADADGVGNVCDSQCIVGAPTTLAGVIPNNPYPGQPVELTGTGFGPSAQVRFDGVVVPVSFLFGKAVATAPTLTLGEHSVTVVNPEGCESQESVMINVVPLSCGLLGIEPLLLVGALGAFRRFRGASGRQRSRSCAS